ncbi:hypothetical protein BDV93DRAFT_280519 [Ceratobasidium sp. AG-I]|nr:hypothetical protein BDV93DRAFT_280519 [Ceratobasidium sp. AG-I]
MSDESYNSLFDEPYSSDEDVSAKLNIPNSPKSNFRVDGTASVISPRGTAIAICHAPPIPGLYFHSQLQITEKMESYLLDSLEQHGYFARPDVNQVMLFGRPRVVHAELGSSESKNNSPGALDGLSGLPSFLDELVNELKRVLSSPLIPPDVYEKLFSYTMEEGRARQAILNRYNPGEGIKAHIDLVNRFADGIIVVSLASGIVMDFAHETKGQAFSTWLPPRSIVILEGEARWEWTHGIVARPVDLIDVTGVEGTKLVGLDQSARTLPDRSHVLEIPRGLRTSVTLRWLLPGANIVGA